MAFDRIAPDLGGVAAAQFIGNAEPLRDGRQIVGLDHADVEAVGA